MNLDFTAEENAFREEVRAFIAENYPPELRKAQDEDRQLTKEEYLSWHKVLAKKGWVAPSWPKEYGGTGWTPTQKYIWSEETARADCLPILPFGAAMLAYAIDGRFFENFDPENPVHTGLLQRLCSLEEFLLASGEVAPEYALLFAQR